MKKTYSLDSIARSLHVAPCRMDELLADADLPADEPERTETLAEAELIRLLMQRSDAAIDAEAERLLLDPNTWASAVGSLVELREKLDHTEYPDGSFGAALKCVLAASDPRRRKPCVDDGHDHGHMLVTAHRSVGLSAVGRGGSPRSEFYVNWSGDPSEDLALLKQTLATATREQDMQALLEQRPRILVQHLRGGHGRWVIPRQRLGSEHVTDFVIGDRCSYGFEWCAVELESPRHPMFTKAGDPSQHLTHAIRQIQDWRGWLLKNHDYASREKVKGGLGLTDIVGDVPGLILIGRRTDADPATHDRRRQMVHDLGIRIQSYDFLVDSLCARVAELKPWPSRVASGS